MDLKPLQDKLVEIAKKHGKEIAAEMVVEIVFPALQMAAKSSAMPWDDAALAVLEEPMKKAALDLIAQL